MQATNTGSNNHNSKVTTSIVYNVVCGDNGEKCHSELSIVPQSDSMNENICTIQINAKYIHGNIAPELTYLHDPLNIDKNGAGTESDIFVTEINKENVASPVYQTDDLFYTNDHEGDPSIIIFVKMDGEGIISNVIYNINSTRLINSERSGKNKNRQFRYNWNFLYTKQ